MMWSYLPEKVQRMHTNVYLPNQFSSWNQLCILLVDTEQVNECAHTHIREESNKKKYITLAEKYVEILI